MTVTPAKLAANRANARKSTGPRTAQGKRRSSKNAISHGMFASEIVLPGEDANLFAQFRTAVLIKLSPQDVVELLLCDRIIAAHWKLRRLNALEASGRQCRSSLPLDRAKRALQRDRDEREYEALTWGKKFKLTARDRNDDRLIEEYERERAANPIRRLAPSEMPAEECDGGDQGGGDDDARIERWSRLEQRLELSIHRNLRMLERLRKQSQSEAGRDPAQCPFLTEDAPEASIGRNEQDDQIEQIEAKDTQVRNSTNPSADRPTDAAGHPAQEKAHGGESVGFEGSFECQTAAIEAIAQSITPSADRSGTRSRS